MSNLKHEFGHSTGHIKHQLSEALKKDTSLPALQKWLPLYIRQETNYEEKKETVLAVIDALAKKPEDGKAEALVLIKYSLGHDKEQKFEAYVKDNHIKIPDIYPDRAKKEFEVYTAVQATPDDQLDLDLARKVAELLPQVPEKELRRTETKELVEKLAITARYMPVMKNFLFNEWPKAVANLPSAATRVQLFTYLYRPFKADEINPEKTAINDFALRKIIEHTDACSDEDRLHYLSWIVKNVGQDDAYRKEQGLSHEDFLKNPGNDPDIN